MRFANFPKVEQSKLSNIIKFQAQEYLPLSIDSVVFDYSIIGETVEASNPKWEVLLVAAKKRHGF